ncbi:MAG TPA: alpha/beta fold hydrolase, partial [Luteimonas sp.]|nr:alpha/beta fold hydrolase [Luteimonas sp.]
MQLAFLRAGFRLAGLLRPDVAVARAGRLFSTPMRGTRQRALQSPDGGAACGGFDMDGHRIATYAWGDPAIQPYVLFAHGWSSHGTRFLPWIPRLREAGYAVVAFDQPAHGRSDGQRTTLPDFACTLFAVARHF